MREWHGRTVVRALGTHVHGEVVVVAGARGVAAGLLLQRGARARLAQLRRRLAQLLLQLLARQARRQRALQDVLAVHLLEAHYLPILNPKRQYNFLIFREH